MATSGHTKSSGYAPLEDVPITPPPYDEQKSSDATQQPNVTVTFPPQTMPTANATTSTGNPGQNNRYKRKVGLVTGALQICIGALIWLCGIVLVAETPFFREWAFDFGFGTLFIVTGILGVVSRNGRTRIIVPYMVMCIISACISCIQMIQGFANTMDIRFHRIYEKEYNCLYIINANSMDVCKAVNIRVLMAFNSIGGICGFAELIIAIVGSVFCCTGTCVCCGTPTQTAIVMYTPAVPACGEATEAPPPCYAPQDSTSSQGQIPAKI